MDHALTLHGINHAPNFFSFLFFSEHPPYKVNVIVLMVCKVPFAELRESGLATVLLYQVTWVNISSTLH